jgi:prepilin peptidase CpaA
MTLVTVRTFLFLSLILLAAYADLRTRRIPNALTAGGLAAGLVTALLAGGWGGLGNAALGAVCGFAVFFALYLLRAMGAGDVKLMAAAGSFLGFPLIVSAALWSAVAGGLVMLIVAFRARAGRRVAGNMGRLLSYWAHSGGIRKAEWLTLDSPGALAIPYGVAVALGCAIAALFPRATLF